MILHCPSAWEPDSDARRSQAVMATEHGSTVGHRELHVQHSNDKWGVWLGYVYLVAHSGPVAKNPRVDEANIKNARRV